MDGDDWSFLFLTELGDGLFDIEGDLIDLVVGSTDIEIGHC